MTKLGLVSSRLGRQGLLIWDSAEYPPKGEWKTILWSEPPGEDPDLLSMSQLIEDNAFVLRRRYLAWLYDLGESNVRGRRIIDHLEITPGFSMYWMTRIWERSYVKSPSIYNAFRLLAVELTVRIHKIDSIILTGSNRSTSRILESFCKRSEIEFQWIPSGVKGTRTSPIHLVKRAIPHPIKAILLLLQNLKERWKFRGTKPASNVPTCGHITFVDYLLPTPRNANSTGHYESIYWGKLIHYLRKLDVRVNWLHLLVNRPGEQSVERAASMIAKFNASLRERDQHMMLFSALSVPLVFEVLTDYIRLIFRTLPLLKIRTRFRPVDSNLDLWPLYREDWFSSLRGSTAMWNLLVLRLFISIFREMPIQQKGFYLHENQGWEKAFLYAWRSAGHGDVIGVQHATVRYWDLRYYDDPRVFRPTSSCALPLADKIAVNGPNASKKYAEAGYPATAIVETEALRYLHLSESQRVVSDSSPSRNTFKILVCCDYQASVTDSMILWLGSICERLPDKSQIVLKPHPAGQVSIGRHMERMCKISDRPLPDLIADSDVVVTSISTSASVEAYCSDCAVIQIYDSRSLNLSPLRGLSGFSYASTSEDLLQSLLLVQRGDQKGKEPYFHLDYDLNRWRTLIGIESAFSSR